METELKALRDMVTELRQARDDWKARQGAPRPGRRHRSRHNGKLPATYRNFEDWGIRPNTIASAAREVVALGFIEVTRALQRRRRVVGVAASRTLLWFPIFWLQSLPNER